MREKEQKTLDRSKPGQCAIQSDWVGESNSTAYTFFNNHGGSSGTAGYIGSTDGPSGRYENLPYNEFEYNQMSGRATILTKSSKYRGQKDFKEQFLDPSRDGKGEMEDQTHHFAAYFALGVANLEFAKDVAMSKDREGGDGDRKLGEQAFIMGRVLSDNPESLGNIGNYIRKMICVSEK